MGQRVGRKKGTRICLNLFQSGAVGNDPPPAAEQETATEWLGIDWLFGIKTDTEVSVQLDDLPTSLESQTTGPPTYTRRLYARLHVGDRGAIKSAVGKSSCQRKPRLSPMKR